MECDICCNAFTSNVRRQITCLFCKDSVCLQCFCRILLMEESEQKCMHCGDELPLEFINLQTPKAFQQKYKQKLVAKLLAQERTLLPETQRIHTLQEEIKILTARVQHLSPYVFKNPKDTLMSDILMQTRTEIYEKTAEINGEQPNEADYPESEASPCPIDTCNGFIVRGKCVRGKCNSHTSFPCPIDTCNGFVVMGKCGICGKRSCVKCRELKEEDHECDPDTIETIKDLLSTTRPCPKCKTRIFKIDGCDQMFCTKCNTAFSWRTGKIETRNVHNPHYFQWLRQNTEGEIPRRPGDNPCLQRTLDKLWRHHVDPTVDPSVRSYARLVRESETIAEDLREKLTQESVNDKRTKFRIQYLKSKSKNSKKQWQIRLTKQLTELSIARELLMIIEMFAPAVQDVLDTTSDKWNHLESKLQSLKGYINDQFTELKKRHGSVATIKLDDRFYVPRKYSTLG
jgi:hypothetical protein